MIKIVLCLFCFPLVSMSMPSIHTQAISWAKSKESRTEFKKFVTGYRDRLSVDLDAGYEDFLGYVEKYLTKIFGEAATKAIVDVLGLPAVQEHVLDMYDHVKSVVENDDCEVNATKAFGDFTFVIATVAITYYTHVPALAVADAAAMVGEFVFDKTGADSALCKAIHKQ